MGMSYVFMCTCKRRHLKGNMSSITQCEMEMQNIQVKRVHTNISKFFIVSSKNTSVQLKWQKMTASLVLKLYFNTDEISGKLLSNITFFFRGVWQSSEHRAN